MLRRRGLLVAVVLIALVGMFAVVSFNDDSGEGAAAKEVGESGLLAALDGAVSGDTIVLTEDATLSRDATIKQDVVLDDNGFSLTISAEIVLKIEGTFVSSGDLVIEYRGIIAVAYGGLMSMNGGTAVIAGSLEVYFGGVLEIGFEEACVLEMQGTGKLLAEGTVNVGLGTLNSAVHVWSATITGKVNISDGSTFKVYDVLTIGTPPTLTSDLENPAVITGKITLDNTAFILVYGNCPGFGPDNIKYPTVKTDFYMLGSLFATEYKDITGKRTLTMPLTSNLRDWSLIHWAAGGTIVTNDSDIQIGSTGFKTISDSSEKINYMVVFAEDKSIVWRVNGIDRGSSFEGEGAYGTTYSVSIRTAPGHTTPSVPPSIYVDGVPFLSGIQVTVPITDITIFTTSNHYLPAKESKVPMLLMILGIMIVILILFLVALVMKNKKKQAA